MKRHLKTFIGLSVMGLFCLSGFTGCKMRGVAIPGEGERVIDESNVYDASVGQELNLEDGMKAKLDGTSSLLRYTRIWIIGDPNNIKHIYFTNHGDGASDYSDSTRSDRQAMEANLPDGVGAIVAYPVSTGDDWPGFRSLNDQRKNFYVLLKMFLQLEKATGRQGANDITFEQFSLSGGGRVNHALMRLILEKYDTDASVQDFVDNHMRGIHDGDSLCYNIDGEEGMTESYIDVLKNFPQIKGTFIHNTSGQMSYVHKYHRKVASNFKELSSNEYPYGGSLSIENGRLRFWSASTHWEAWKGQFAKVFFGNQVGQE